MFLDRHSDQGQAGALIIMVGAMFDTNMAE
jgi:hypothetical protein